MRTRRARALKHAHIHAFMHTHACVAAYTCVNTTENAVARTKPATLTNLSNKIQCKKNNNETLKKETKTQEYCGSLKITQYRNVKQQQSKLSKKYSPTDKIAAANQSSTI